MLRAIVYTVYRCGFFPKTALDEDDGSDNRLTKIIRKIRDSRYGIHDLSRIELSNAAWPRFNMPFELGIFFGAKNLGDDHQKRKNALVPKEFTAHLPVLTQTLGFTADNIPYVDFLHLMEDAVKVQSR